MYNGLIVFGKKVSQEFRDKIISICINLGIDVNWLMAAIAFESGETFSASVKNAAGSGAVGLIQFMDSTAKALGTSLTGLANMTAVQQLDYVLKYFSPYKGKLKSIEDVYMTILWPAAVGKPLSYNLFTKGNTTYLQNRGLDLNKDGKITKAEAAGKVREKFERGLLPEFCFISPEYHEKNSKLADTIKKGVENV